MVCLPGMLTWLIALALAVVLGPWVLFGAWAAWVSLLMWLNPPGPLPFRDPMGERLARERAERARRA
jgi:hypothetical protein